MIRLGYVKWGLVMILGASFNTMAAEAKIELRRTPERGWELLRNGAPYFVKGIGGRAPLAKAKELGANSVRYWGIQELAETNSTGKTNLEEIEELGMTVAAGIWVEHERHGFSYSEPKDVLGQREKVREAVRLHRDHPSVLIWGLGNEMEAGMGEAEAVRVWKELEELAKIVKAEDPGRPVMTVIAGADEEKVRAIMEHYPSIDILGINAYSGAAGVGLKLHGLGWTKP